jgi:hypothetical protein
MKPFTRIAALLLAFIAALQAIRFLAGWLVTIDGLAVPVWASAIFALVAGLLAVMLWREARD